jgi:hypothetical protein
MEAGKRMFYLVTTQAVASMDIKFIELAQRLQRAPPAQTQNILDYVQKMNQLIPTDFEFSLNVNRN